MGEPRLTWARPTHVGAEPVARGGHAAAQVDNLMIVHGGQYYFRGKFYYQDDLWALDSDAVPLKWHCPSCVGGKPGARYGHSAASVPGANKVYFFGGKGDNNLLYNDLWLLDVENWRWELCSSTSAPPSPRYAHAAVSIGDRLLVHGGRSGDGEVVTDGVWLYDRATVAWMRPRCTGIPPSPRQGHAAAFDASSGRLIVFGGCAYDKAGVPAPLNDTRELDLTTMAWSRPSTGGDVPSARYGMATSQLANCLVVFGGWRGPEEYTGRPTVQADGGPTTVSIPHKSGMGFGSSVGGAGATVTVPYAVHPDLFLYDLDSREYVRPKVAGSPPGYRYGGSLVTRGLEMLYFGGWEDGKALNEVLVLDLSALAQ